MSKRETKNSKRSEMNARNTQENDSLKGSSKRKVETQNLGPAKRSNAAPQKVARSKSDNPSSGMSRSRSAAVVDQIPISNRKEPSSLLASENSQNNSGEFEEDNSLGSQAENDRSNSNSSVKSSAQDVHSTTNEYSLDIVSPDLPLDISNSPATILFSFWI